MKCPKYWVSICLALMPTVAKNREGDPTYTSVHTQSSATLQAPSPEALFELIIEHGIAVHSSSADVLFKNSFCSDIRNCVKNKMLSSDSSLDKVYAAQPNEKDIPNPLPSFYKDFLLAIPSIVASSTPLSTTKTEHVLLQPSSNFEDSVDLNNTKAIHALSPVLEESIKQAQRRHIQSFYLKQLQARFVNWCYSSDYANLIYPFLPPDEIMLSRVLKASFCRYPIPRTFFIILRHIPEHLASEDALPLFFTSALSVHLREVSNYTNIALKNFHLTHIPSKEENKEQLDDPNVISCTKTNNTLVRGNLRKTEMDLEELATLGNRDGIQSASEVSEVTSDNSDLQTEEDETTKLSLDIVTDSILIGCRTLMKVPYYFSQDPQDILFQYVPSTLIGFITSNPKTNSFTNSSPYDQAMKICDALTPIIIKSYKKDKEREKHHSYYKAEPNDLVYGRQIVFPHFPMEKRKVKDLTNIEYEKANNCQDKASYESETPRDILHCLRSLSKKFSLMLGVIASNFYTTIPEYTRKVVPVLEKYQAVELVAIYFDHIDKNAHLEEESIDMDTRERIKKEAIEGDTEKESALKLIISDILLDTMNFYTEIIKAASQSLEVLIALPAKRRNKEKLTESKTILMSKLQELTVDEMFELTILNSDSTSFKLKYPATLLGCYDDEQKINKAGGSKQLEEEHFGDLMEEGDPIKPGKKNKKRRICEEGLKSSPGLIKTRENSKAILKNILEKLSALPVTDCLTSRDQNNGSRVVYDRKEGVGQMINNQVNIGCILNIYDNLNHLYQLSLAASPLLLKIVRNTITMPIKSVFGISQRSFSFPGETLNECWFAWTPKAQTQFYYNINNKTMQTINAEASDMFQSFSDSNNVTDSEEKEHGSDVIGSFEAIADTNSAARPIMREKEKGIDLKVPTTEKKEKSPFYLFCKSILRTLQISEPKSSKPTYVMFKKYIKNLLALLKKYHLTHQKHIIINGLSGSDLIEANNEEALEGRIISEKISLLEEAYLPSYSQEANEVLRYSQHVPSFNAVYTNSNNQKSCRDTLSLKCQGNMQAEQEPVFPSGSQHNVYPEKKFREKHSLNQKLSFNPQETKHDYSSRAAYLQHNRYYPMSAPKQELAEPPFIFKQEYLLDYSSNYPPHNYFEMMPSGHRKDNISTVEMNPISSHALLNNEISRPPYHPSIQRLPYNTLASRAPYNLVPRPFDRYSNNPFNLHGNNNPQHVLSTFPLKYSRYDMPQFPVDDYPVDTNKPLQNRSSQYLHELTAQPLLPLAPKQTNNIRRNHKKSYESQNLYKAVIKNTNDIIERYLSMNDFVPTNKENKLTREELRGPKEKKLKVEEDVAYIEIDSDPAESQPDEIQNEGAREIYNDHPLIAFENVYPPRREIKKGPNENSSSGKLHSEEHDSTLIVQDRFKEKEGGLNLVSFSTNSNQAQKYELGTMNSFHHKLDLDAGFFEMPLHTTQTIIPQPRIYSAGLPNDENDEDEFIDDIRIVIEADVSSASKESCNID